MDRQTQHRKILQYNQMPTWVYQFLPKNQRQFIEPRIPIPSFQHLRDRIYAGIHIIFTFASWYIKFFSSQMFQVSSNYTNFGTLGVRYYLHSGLHWHLICLYRFGTYQFNLKIYTRVIWSHTQSLHRVHSVQQYRLDRFSAHHQTFVHHYIRRRNSCIIRIFLYGYIQLAH